MSSGAVTAASLLEQLNRRQRPPPASSPSSPSPPPRAETPPPEEPPVEQDKDLPCWTRAAAQHKLSPADTTLLYALRYHLLGRAARGSEAFGRVAALPPDEPAPPGDAVEWASGAVDAAVREALRAVSTEGTLPRRIVEFVQGAARVLVEVVDAPAGALSAWSGAPLAKRAIRLVAIRAADDAEETDEILLEPTLPGLTPNNLLTVVQLLVAMAAWQTTADVLLGEMSAREADEGQLLRVLMTHQDREQLVKFCTTFLQGLRFLKQYGEALADAE